MFRLIFTSQAILYFLTALLSVTGAGRLFGQSKDSLNSELTIDFELRPRVEFRNNFVWNAADSVMREFYITQRNRLNVTYQTRRLRLHASPQEIHVWGENERISRVGSMNFFELYAEPTITKHLSIRIGRQALSLDNGRIFSAAPWSQQSRSHEGVRFFYKNRFETDLTLAFTRRYDKHYDPAYSPVSAHTYKFLFVHHLKYRFRDRAMLTTINAMDVFRQTSGEQKYYQRMTNGGRLEHTSDRLNATVNAYYQHGKTADLGKIHAYYVQPEIGFNTGKTLFRIGAEIMSGTKSDVAGKTSHSFVPLYGVAWKFMGNMNLFTRFPADVNGKGLLNPYIFVMHQAGKKLSIRGDAHLFYTQYPLTEAGKEIDGTFLGFESDLSLNYKPVKGVEISYEFSFTLANQRMELLHKVKDSEKIPVWSYLMISYTPRLLTRQWNAR